MVRSQRFLNWKKHNLSYVLGSLEIPSTCRLEAGTPTRSLSQKVRRVQGPIWWCPWEEEKRIMDERPWRAHLGLVSNGLWSEERKMSFVGVTPEMLCPLGGSATLRAPLRGRQNMVKRRVNLGWLHGQCESAPRCLGFGKAKRPPARIVSIPA